MHKSFDSPLGFARGFGKTGQALRRQSVAERPTPLIRTTAQKMDENGRAAAMLMNCHPDDAGLRAAKAPEEGSMHFEVDSDVS
jgi:hypothetical protein